jgi:excisionase family DNA binding protein
MPRKRHTAPPHGLPVLPTEPRAFTVLQLAKRWQCSPHTVRAAIVSGKLVGFRVGERQWRVSEAEVVRYETEQQQPARAS